MKTRKVQKTGGSTYTVSLPKDWADEHLDFGDSLSIEQSENHLKLFKDGYEAEKQRACLNYEGEIHPLFRKTVALYLSGYDQINIVSRGSIEGKDKFHNMMKQNMVGMEVLRSEDNRIEMKNLVRYEDLPFNQVLIRIDSLLNKMMAEVLNYLEGNSLNLENVRLKEQELDRMYLLGVRQLKKAATNPETLKKLEIETESECVSLRVILKSLERIGDHTRKIAEELNEMQEIKEEYEEYFEDVAACYRLSMEALRKRDLQRAEKAIKKIRSTTSINKKDLSNEDYIKFREIEQATQRIKLLSDDIAEITINIAIVEREESIFEAD